MSKPFVSILTPTRDRRDFLPELFRAVRRQDYPQDRLEVVVVDDGRDRVEDMMPDDLNVIYEHLGQRVPLGRKRNRLVERSQGEFLVHFDDDDWHPADRVSRSVQALLDTPDACVAGRSDMVFWELATGNLHQLPVIGPKHVTAGSMTYRRSWWSAHRFAAVPHTEERQFLDNFEAPVLQLDGPAWRTVVAISHGGNILPKNTHMPLAAVGLEEAIPDPQSRAFFLERLEEAW